MANPILDIDEIVRFFPGRIENERGQPCFNLTSPFDVALRENQLRIAGAELDLGHKVPAHYLVYAQGNPESREQSRIGGLPYRPRQEPWPTDSDGKPKEFICQLDFSDSHGLIPEPPGEIMLLFASEEGVDDAPFVLEWYPRGLKDIMNASDLPRFAFAFPMIQHEPVFCYLYKTYDFPEAETRILGTRFEAWKSFGVPCGSKIGGFDPSTTSGRAHVFTLESIRLLYGEPFPFVNRKNWEPESLIGRLFARGFRAIQNARGARNRCYDILMIGDVGRVHILRDENGEFQVPGVSY